MLPSQIQPRPATIAPGRPMYVGGFLALPPRAVALRYLQGDCGYFALACHALLPGSQLWRVGVGHFAVEDQAGQFWDIRGRLTLEQLWSGLAGPTMVPLTRAQVIAELDSGVYGDGSRFVASRETAARSVARRHVPGLPPVARRRAP